MLECGLTSEDDANLLRIFPGRSQLAELMRCFDWLQTDLGAPQNWPPNLRIAISLCLTSRFPILLWWGQSLTVLYNDAYVSFLGEVKHPFCLGRPGRECWPEIWDTIGPMLENVLRTGEATWSDDFLFFFNRKVPREEVHVRFTYSPILASDGRHVDGVFTPCTEITEEVISARRLATLRQIGAHTDQSRTAESACRQAASVLAENPMDVPCAAIYLLNKDGVHLTADVLPNGDAFPSAIPWDELGISSWPFEPVIRTRCAIEMDVAPTGAGAHLKSQQWPDPVRRAMVLPMAGSPHSPVVGLLIAGISPRRPFDVQYATFFELVAQHIGTRLADVRAYEDERERADALTKLDEAKTAFFSNVSHEFRTPLTLMLGPIQEVLARGSGELPADVRGKLELVNRNSERMLKLVNTLLDFSRIEAGRMTARHELTNLASFTAELCSFFRSAIENAGLDFIVNCPPLAGAVYVDRGMWEKIVLNLLSNALKFTFTGNIGLDLVQVDTLVELRVSDTGTGIPKEEIPYLFERFHRVEGARGRTFEGTGIGLALVKELVQLHHGTVRAASGVGEGSVFIVSIPLGRAHLAPDRLGTHVTQAVHHSGRRRIRYGSSAVGIQATNVEHRSEFSWLPVKRPLPHAAGMPRASTPGG